MNRPNFPKAFTLIELLVVLVILAVLAAVIVPSMLDRPEQARRASAAADISNLKIALSAFHIDNGRFPTTAETLDALVTCPAGLENSWKSPYIEQVRIDPWTNDYIYRFPGTDDSTSFDLLSTGRDGAEGTEDDITKLSR